MTGMHVVEFRLQFFLHDGRCKSTRFELLLDVQASKCCRPPTKTWAETMGDKSKRNTILIIKLDERLLGFLLAILVSTTGGPIVFVFLTALYTSTAL